MGLNIRHLNSLHIRGYTVEIRHGLEHPSLEFAITFTGTQSPLIIVITTTTWNVVVVMMTWWDDDGC